jgi:hypothetical protein
VPRDGRHRAQHRAGLRRPGVPRPERALRGRQLCRRPGGIPHAEHAEPVAHVPLLGRRVDRAGGGHRRPHLAGRGLLPRHGHPVRVAGRPRGSGGMVLHRRAKRAVAAHRPHLRPEAERVRALRRRRRDRRRHGRLLLGGAVLAAGSALRFHHGERGHGPVTGRRPLLDQALVVPAGRRPDRAGRRLLRVQPAIPTASTSRPRSTSLPAWWSAERAPSSAPSSAWP